MSARWILYASCLASALAADTASAQPPKAKDGPLGMKFVSLPKATFYMGWDGEKKGTKTEIKENFEIAIHTVTQGQWQEIMGNNPSHFSREGGGKDAVKDIPDADLKQFPVEKVSWDDAQEFIKKLNNKERGKGYVYRLPTEAEWEYACRGGATSEEECAYHFYFAKPTNDLSSEQANFLGDFPSGKAPKGKTLGRPAKVGSYAPNKLGLYDMHGNVHQWCADLLTGDKDRVNRGGSFGNNGAQCQAAKGYRIWSRNRAASCGFRLARVPGALAGFASPTPEPGPLGMKFARLPEGTFYMGWDGEKKGKKTEIKEDFEVAVHTVTQDQWQTVMGKNPSYFSRNGAGKLQVKDIKDEDLKQFPVDSVSFVDAQEFIKKLNETEKKRGYEYRLPTEAEWEYACRGGATSEEECSYHFYVAKPTNDLSSKQANFNGDHPFGKADKGPYLGRTTKVGSYAPNKLGLYDMHGNVQQWCNDENRNLRPIRGGSWSNHGESCRAGFRNYRNPAFADFNYGFRLVRVPVR